MSTVFELYKTQEQLRKDIRQAEFLKIMTEQVFDDVEIDTSTIGLITNRLEYAIVFFNLVDIYNTAISGFMQGAFPFGGLVLKQLRIPETVQLKSLSSDTVPLVQEVIANIGKLQTFMNNDKAFISNALDPIWELVGLSTGKNLTH